MKHLKYLLLLTLCLLLAACGPKEPAPKPSSVPEVSSQSGSASPPAPDVSEPDASAPDSSEAEAIAAAQAQTEAKEKELQALREELAAAHQAALDYYMGTVFEVETLTEIEPRQGEIAFRVSCSKDGVKVDPDRTIFLERQEGVWTVINEGY